MSLINKRRMQERERRNGLADTIEVQKFFVPQIVECKSVKSLSIDNASLMNVAYSIPCDGQKGIMGSQVEGHVQQAQFLTHSWPVAAENHEQKVDLNDLKLISIPQGAYYDVPIIIDPVNYQLQQDQSFNVSPEQMENLPTTQIPCTNANCVHCKPPNAS